MQHCGSRPLLQRVGTQRFRAPFFVAVMLLRSLTVLAQESHPNSLSASEAYKLALSPLSQARSQQEDLTEADKLALNVGIASASRSCAEISSGATTSVKDSKEVLALGQLCILGHQYDLARESLVRYLGDPGAADRELALELLVSALVGSGDTFNAEIQVRSLLRDYTYNPAINGSIDQVIEATEGRDADQNTVALGLCDAQSEAILPLLEQGKRLIHNDDEVSPAQMMNDALRCAALSSETAEPGPGDALAHLAAIVESNKWAGTIDSIQMQAALWRQQMVGLKTPLKTLNAKLLRADALTPYALPLNHGRVLLVPFTLWALHSLEIARDLTHSLPQRIYLVTSWASNSSGQDAPSKQILDGLRNWKTQLPANCSLLVVPDEELKRLNAVSFPSGILIDSGVIKWNGALLYQGAERRLLNVYKSRAAKASPTHTNAGALTAEPRHDVR